MTTLTPAQTMVDVAEAQCAGKNAFASHAMASQVAMKMGRARGAMRGRVSVYRCQHCGAWHIGHAIGRSIRR